MAFNIKTMHNFNVSDEADRLEHVNLDELLRWCWEGLKIEYSSHTYIRKEK